MSDYRVLDNKKQVHDLYSALPINEETLRALQSWYYVPDNCTVGDTCILDGIECLCIATDVEIQGSNYTRIAVDRNYYLDHYCNYLNTTIDGVEITQDVLWKWGAYGVTVGASDEGIGYGLQNTELCLNNSNCFDCSGYTSNYTNYPILWKGVLDFRNGHSDRWFVPSLSEANIIRTYASTLYPGASQLELTNYSIWTSTEYSNTNAYYTNIANGSDHSIKYYRVRCRMCRAF